MLSITVYSIWLAAYYPGAMSGDSWVQWRQARGDEPFHNHHPFVHTLYILILTSIFTTPVVVSIFQILLTSALVAVIADYFWLKSKSVTIIMTLCYLVSPVIGIYNVTLWKDVLFSQLVLAISCIFVITLSSKKKLSNLAIVLLSLLLVFTSLVRHNGIMYLLLIPVLYLIFKTMSWKQFLLFLFTIVILYGSAVYLLKPALQVQEVYFTSRAILIHMVSGIVRFGGEVSESDKQIIEEQVPLDNIKDRFHCSAVDYIVFHNPEFKGDVINRTDYVQRFDRFSIRFILKNMPYFFAERACTFSYAVGLGDDKYSYLYEKSLLENMKIDYGIAQDGIDRIKINITDPYLLLSRNNPILRLIFWSHFLYITLFLMAFIWSIYYRDKVIFSYTILYLANVALIFMVGIARDYRYLYMLHLGIPLLLGLMYYTNKDRFRKIYAKILARK